MTEDRLRSYGVFLLRVALGTMFIAHSTIYMLMTLTLAGTGKFFVSIGLPAWLAYATFFPRRLVEYSSFWVSGHGGWRWCSRRS
jgi:uncharacterized membrane protein